MIIYLMFCAWHSNGGFVEALSLPSCGCEMQCRKNLNKTSFK